MTMPGRARKAPPGLFGVAQLKILVLSMSPARDWTIDEQIGLELTKMGHQAVLRQFLQDGRDAVVIEKPDVALIPVVRCPYTRDFARRLKQWGVKVVARRSEAGVSGRAYEKMPRHLQLNQVGRYPYDDYVDMELVWGREFADVLIRENVIRADKIRLIGGIGLDIYFSSDCGRRIRDLAGTRESFIGENKLDPSKRILFWAGGFKMADVNPDYTLPEAPVGDAIHGQLHRRDVDGRRVWLDALRQLYAKHGHEYNFFVRPHPGETCSRYTDELPAGIRVSLAGGVAAPLVHCDVLIHAGSTLAVDAHVLCKPAFNFYGAAEDDVIGDVSPKCQTTAELDQCLKEVTLGKSNALIASIHDLERFYGVIDGQACKRVAQAVHEFADADIRTVIPGRWPEDEFNDYTTRGVMKLAKVPILYCQACKKPFQVLNGDNHVPCPHCSIAVKINQFTCIV